MNEINSKFKQEYDNGIAVPNERQWSVLEERLFDTLFFASAKMDVDPASNVLRHRALIMASTLGPITGNKLMAVYDVYAFQLNRFRAKALEIAQKQEKDYMQQGIFEQAMGHSPRFWHYEPESDPRFKEANKQGAKVYAWATGVREGMNVEEVMPEEFEKAYSAGHEFTKRQTKQAKNVKAQESLFGGAYAKIRDNIRTFDGIFSKRFYLFWDLSMAQDRYQECEVVLTKPLDEYTYHFRGHGYGRDNKEYSHRGAQRAWEELKQVRRLESELEMSATLLNDQTWDIEQLIEDTRGMLINYNTALSVARADDLRRTGRSSVQLTTKSAAREKQEKLAKKSIKVSMVKRDGGMWINHLELLKGLVGRGGWLSLDNERIIHITRFRQWLEVALKGIETKKRVRKLDQHDWIQIDLDAIINDSHGMPEKMAIRLWTSGGLRVTAHFYNQLEEVNQERHSSRLEPVIHEVEYKEVKDQISRKVWTPKDINKYRPVLAIA